MHLGVVHILASPATLPSLPPETLQRNNTATSFGIAPGGYVAEGKSNDEVNSWLLR